MVDDGSGKALMSNKAPLTALTIPALDSIEICNINLIIRRLFH